MEWYLVDLVHQNREYPLSLGENSIGRQLGSKVYTTSIYSSRRHCIIEVEEGSLDFIKIKDLNSSNGTFLNEQKLIANRRVDLAAGDTIGIGTTAEQEEEYFIFRVSKRLSPAIQVSRVKNDPDTNPQRRQQNAAFSGPSNINSVPSHNFNSSLQGAIKDQQKLPHLSLVKQEGEKRKRNGDRDASREEGCIPKIPKLGGLKNGSEVNGRVEPTTDSTGNSLSPESMEIDEAGALSCPVQETNNFSPSHSRVNASNNCDSRNNSRKINNSEFAHNVPSSHQSSENVNSFSAQTKDSRKPSLDRTKRFSKDKDVEIIDISEGPSNAGASTPDERSRNSACNNVTAARSPSDLSHFNNQIDKALAHYGRCEPTNTSSKSSVLEETDKLLNASKHRITVNVQNSKTSECDLLSLAGDNPDDEAGQAVEISDAIKAFNNLPISLSDNEDDYPYDEFDEFVEEDSKNWYGQLSQSLSQSHFDDGGEGPSGTSELSVSTKPTYCRTDTEEDVKPFATKPMYLSILNDENFDFDDEVEILKSEPAARRSSRSVSSNSESEIIRTENEKRKNETVIETEEIATILGEPISLSSSSSSSSASEDDASSSFSNLASNKACKKKLEGSLPEPSSVNKSGSVSPQDRGDSVIARFDEITKAESKAKNKPRQAELIDPVPQMHKKALKLQEQHKEKKKTDSTSSKKSALKPKSTNIAKTLRSSESNKDKQQFKENRRGKLKELGLKDRERQEQERLKNYKPKTSAPVRTKNSMENRSKCFIENFETPSATTSAKKSKNNRSVPAPIEELDFSAPSTSKVGVDTKVIHRGPKQRVSRVGDRSTEPKAAIPSPHSAASKTSSTGEQESYKIPKSKKKKVSFPPDDQLEKVVFIEYSSGSSKFNKVQGRKDAELPALPQMESSEPSDSIIHHILKWRPDWLHEQKRREEHPPVSNKKLEEVKLKYESSEEYYSTMKPLLEHELWQSMTQDYERHFSLGPVNEARSDDGRYTFHVIVENCSKRQMVKQPHRKFLQLNCNAVLNPGDIKRQTYPRRDDLVIVNVKYYDDANAKKDPPKTYNVFARVCFEKQNRLTQTSMMSLKPLEKLKEHPCVVLTLRLECYCGSVLDNKCILCGPSEQSVMEVKKIKSLIPELRLFHGLRALHFSPLCNAILSPDTHEFSISYAHKNEMLPILNDIVKDLNRSQQKAVDYATKMCFSDEPSFCLIQGAPGTGKSLVITRIIQQILKCREQIDESEEFTVLLCASSNAAVDELVVRLGEINRKAKATDRFSLVRFGRKENQNISTKAKPYLLSEIVNQKANEIDNAHEYYLDVDIRMLKAKVNSLAQTIKDYENLLRRHLINGGMTSNELQLKRSWEEKKQKAEFDRTTTINEIKKLEAMKVNQTPGIRLHAAKMDAELQVLQQAQVVAVTLSSCISHQMKTVFMPDNKTAVKSQISVCIIDEATQCTELESLIPLLLGVKSLILVGDPKQLSPTVLSATSQKFGYGQSLFHRIQQANHNKKFPFFFLDTQYRMHSEICSWPNRHFYHGKLTTDPSVDQKFDKNPLLPYVVLSTNFKATEECIDKNEVNKEEASMVVSLILDILTRPACRKMSMGVITPYQKQKTIYQSLFASRKVPKAVEVNTIDSYQGSEKDIIILSTVRTHGVGFLESQARLNVSLTRAKSSLFICGNFVSLQDDRTWRALMDDAKSRKVFKKVAPNRNGKYISYVLKKPDLSSC